MGSLNTRGRCIRVEKSDQKNGSSWSVTIKNLSGVQTVETATEPRCLPGDLVEFRDGKETVLTSNLRPGRATAWMDRILDERRLRNMKTRSQVEALIREFFLERDFLETRTPLRVPCPGMEIHIRPFSLSQGGYLPTSPEFAMKRLLVGGLEKVFQIAPVFRDESTSQTHHPEFTMLEWYRAYAGYESIMEDTENLFAFVAERLFGKAQISYEGKTIDFTPPWPRLRISELFITEAGVDLTEHATPEALAGECRRLGLQTQKTDTWDDLFFRIWLNQIEPKLPRDRAVIVYGYPPSQAALAVIEKDRSGQPWAKRFEVYAGGLELGNAFEELTDAKEQRRRFEEDMRTRQQIYGSEFPPTPLDEEFLEALEEGMPPSGGIAVGVDRMAMLFADEIDIDQVLWLRSDQK